MNSALPAVNDASPSSDSGKNSIQVLKTRRTPELVMALCGFVGSGVTSVGLTLKSTLQRYGYDKDEIDIIKISNFIREDNSITKVAKKNIEDIINLQTYGNQLRKKHGNTYLAARAIVEIAKERPDQNSQGSQPSPRRHITIIDSLKRPEEYELLKLVYGPMFYMLGVICPVDIRKRRLLLNIGNKDAIDRCINIDREEKDDGGQMTAKTLTLSDFYVNNFGDTEKFHQSQVERFIELVLGIPDHSPTNDEYGMFCAYAASLRSGCMSRQVGAAIMKDGVILATGRNDVPKHGGGLYTEEDDGDDNRCFKKYGQSCQSDHKKAQFVDEFRRLLDPLDLAEAQKESITEALRKYPKLKSMVEYTRSVHAEMDAITSVSRMGGAPLQGATLYCTTFPCHHCAKLILAAGISNVIFIEPYDKSLSYEMYSNSIVVDNSENYYPEKLHMHYLSGVAPKSYAKLFEYQGRKDPTGKLICQNYQTLMPHFPVPIDNFIINEINISKMLEEYVVQRIDK